MRAHEAGALHAEGYRGPTWLQLPHDVNALTPSLWAQNVGRSGDGVLQVAGVPVTDLAAKFGTPAYVVDEADFRWRAKEFAKTYDEIFGDLCGGADVYYAGKAFLCTEVARWIRDDGLNLDVCSGGELLTALRAGFPAERIAFHGNNKSTAELELALDAGVGRYVVDSFEEIARLAFAARERATVADVLVRVTVGVEAHTHEFIATAHEDQKFGFSLAGGDALEAVRRIVGLPSLRLLGLHSHIGSQIFDTAGFEVSAHRLVGLAAAVRDELGVAVTELDLGGGMGIAYTEGDDPISPKEMADLLRDIVTRECTAYGLALPRLAVEPGRAVVGQSMITVYEVGTVKKVDLGSGHARHYVSVDGGMSDNIRPALYHADYSARIACRVSDAEPILVRVAGKHCESGDIVVHAEYLPGDVAAGDLLAIPATGAYGWAMASNYNWIARPPVVAVRDGRARIIVRGETVDDLLARDAGVTPGRAAGSEGAAVQ